MSKDVLRFGMLATLVWSLWWANAARAGDVLLVGFDDSAAVAANGPIPGANGVPEVTPADICGASDKSYLAELIDTPPAEVKVIEHWADIVPGKEMMVSGIVHGVSLGGHRSAVRPSVQRRHDLQRRAGSAVSGACQAPRHGNRP